MNSRILISEAARELEAADITDAKLDASLLLSAVCGHPPLQLRIGMDISDSTIEAFHRMVSERVNHKPLQYILGNQPFCKRMFMVDERVLIPRPETELLAQMACAWLRGRNGQQQVLDLCCGSGCIGITIALEHPGVLVTSSDISEDALDVTRANAEALKASITTVKSDLFDQLVNKQFDLIISNPPYIPAEECAKLQPEVLQEPMLALNGGADGLDLYRRIATESRTYLRHGGRLMLEVGINEDGDVCTLLKDHGFTDVQVFRDLNGIQRMISAG